MGPGAPAQSPSIGRWLDNMLATHAWLNQRKNGIRREWQNCWQEKWDQESPEQIPAGASQKITSLLTET